MERRFTVEAKTFSFSAKEGNSVIRLKEKRKGFGGFIFLGIKCSDWLTDTVEEALEAQKKEEFARSFRDEVRVLKVRMGSNKAGCFLEVAVFVEGGRKGVIRIPEGHGGWGWQRFVDELRTLLAHLVEKVPPAVVIAGEVDSSPSFVEVVTPPGGVKPPLMEAQAPVTDLGSRLRPLSTSSDCSSEVLRQLAMDFLAKVRAEVDRILFFGLGLKIGPSRDIRRRMGRLFSQLGLKPKLLFGFKQRGRCKSRGLSLRPRSSAVVSQIKSNAGVDWVPVSDAGQGVASPEMVPVVSAVEYSDTVISGDDAFRGSVADSEEEISVAPSGPSPAKTMFRRGSLRSESSLSPSGEVSTGEALGFAESCSGFSDSPEMGSAVSGEVVLEKDPDLEPVQGGGLSDEQREDCMRVFLDMFPDSVSCSQGADFNTPMENGLTIPQWRLLEWLRGQVKHDEAQLTYLMGVEEGARRLNKVAIPPGAVEGSELMQSELMQVVFRDLGK
jgi:hypothetical protein